MSFYCYVKKIVKAPFHLVGLDLVRREEPDPDPDPPPPLFQNPLEALCYRQGGKPAAFECPLSATVIQNGFSYSSDGWHPFVATLREYAVGGSSGYDDSILKQYYETHRPANGAEAIVGFGEAPGPYAEHPPHAYRVTPWRSLTVNEIDRRVREWSKEHGEEHGDPEHDWLLEADGYQYHGPVSDRKGRLEYRRLVDVYESIDSEGYDRRLGHAHFLVLKRDGDIRFSGIGPGNHRAAAMAALGFETIPSIFYKFHVVDVDMAEYWPQVRRGAWTQEQAEAYFDHLFDFDSRAWAREHDLLPEQRPRLTRADTHRGDR